MKDEPWRGDPGARLLHLEKKIHNQKCEVERLYALIEKTGKPFLALEARVRELEASVDLKTGQLSIMEKYCQARVRELAGLLRETKEFLDSLDHPPMSCMGAGHKCECGKDDLVCKVDAALKGEEGA